MNKKRGRSQKININLSNRWLYTLILIGILIAIGVGVYAATYTASGAGHPYTEISTCPTNGQILKMSNGTWTCGSDTTGGHGDGTNCAAGQYPLGVDANGNAQSCTADKKVSSINEITPPSLCSANQFLKWDGNNWTCRDCSVTLTNCAETPTTINTCPSGKVMIGFRQVSTIYYLNCCSISIDCGRNLI